MTTKGKSDIKRAVALGFFDGVHLGHQALVKRLSEQRGCEKWVYTFINHPSTFFGGDKEKNSQEHLCTPFEKAELLKGYGADQVYMADFDEKIANTSPEDFLRFLAEDLGASVIISGKNYRFGKGAAGDSSYINEFVKGKGIEYWMVDLIEKDREPVSSTRIKQALLRGDIQTANGMLGRFYSLSGMVEDGRKIGRTLDLPTANIAPPEGKVLPLDGVYGGFVLHEDKHLKAIVNIGSNPTVGGIAKKIETHILGFNGDLYGKNITIKISRRLRDEIKFESKSALKEQIQRDILRIK